MAKIIEQGVEMTAAASEFVRECGVDVQADVEEMIGGRTDRAALRERCLFGADFDRREGILDYALAIEMHAEREERKRAS